MALLLESTELTALMQDFYVLTGIRIVLFDEGGCELLSYPTGEESFCSCMRKNPDFEAKCAESDKRAFAACRRTKELTVYRCHGGLIEATVPIVEKGRIIGYMMLGQITDNKNKEQLFAEMRALCESYGITENLEDALRRIKYKNSTQIRSAANILAACTEYIRLKELVKPVGQQLIDSLSSYVDEHMSEDIDVSRVCEALHVSRTRLYESLRPYVKGGVADFVKQRRLLKAKELITSTDLPISAIAEAVGFADYNYFLRVFKQVYGVSSGNLRKKASGRKDH
ncbi:MAG: PocR ligand-binding domain-containing protein [Clostridia bacterium]|nr:PocR ligand-binding domain-containing protein [Clostridia bacterium]